MYNRLIQVFEYDRLKIGDFGFTIKHFDALAVFSERQKTPWFRLGYRCIHFSHYVGVIQIEGLTIEILPKTDKGENKGECQKHLIEMLCQIGNLKLSAPTNALLKWKKRSILDLYIGYFIIELKILIHRGLIRRYRREQGNQKALKGKLLVGKQIRENLVHKERFYCEYTTYDRDHLLHQVLNEALKMLTSYSGARPWISEIRSLLMDFPECKSININEAIFSKINWDRKNKAYSEAIQIAKMLLLNFHPDLSSGSNDVLALLFNMNDLFESWILSRLKKAANNIDNVVVSGQKTKRFWTNEQERYVNIRPDILVFHKGDPILVLDTKWKRLTEFDKPSASDLQQLFAYNHLFDVRQSYLLYPSTHQLEMNNGYFGKNQTDRCGICLLPIIKNGKLNKEIGEELLKVFRDIKIC